MFTGEPVTIRRKITIGTDDFGAELVDYQGETIDNVIIAPATSSDLSDDLRPNGVKIMYTVHIPREYTESLKDTEFLIGGQWLRSVGDPQPYRDYVFKMPWNRGVSVGVTNG